MGGVRADDGKFYWDQATKTGEVFDKSYWIPNSNVQHGTPDPVLVCLRAVPSSTENRYDVSAVPCDQR